MNLEIDGAGIEIDRKGRFVAAIDDGGNLALTTYRAGGPLAHLLANRRRGPGLSRMLTAVAASVADEVASRRRIEAERAKPRSTARLVTLITLGVAGVLMLNGTYLAPYRDGLGQLVLGAIAAAFAGCLLWIRALTLARPAARFLTGGESGGSR